MPMLNLNNFGLTEPTSERVRRKFPEVVPSQIKNLSTLLAVFREQVQSIRTSGKFTAIGLRDEVAKVGQLALKELDEQTATPPKMLRQRIEQGGGPTGLPKVGDVAKRSGESEVVVFLKSQELRRHLQTIDPLNRRPLLLDAVKNDDAELLAAATDVHAALRPIDDVLLSELTGAYLERSMPEDARAARETLAAFQSNTATARRLIEREAGLPVSNDPIANAATAADAA